MKKTLLSVIAGLAVISSASAGIKETCLEHPDKLVWVEKTQRCIPINPCESDDKNIKDVYCNMIFYERDLREDKVETVLDRYLSRAMSTKGKEYNINTDSNFVAVKTVDDGYVVFPFRDIGVRYGAVGADSAMLFRIACQTFDYGDVLAVSSTVEGPCKKSYDCVLPTMQECYELDNFYEKLSGSSSEMVSWDGKYCKIVVDTAIMRNEDGRCME